ncbi:hypothetical protein AYO20_00947 [Fonsecaea nubica]|uniref:DUF8035 domain-containing protein n=1 Tax=Fonsecaea nubica TaxID=856822 RepID=A0A178DBB3_9EURO|nr:hypothetical protein AYO20_00947 [Fonsecaea nubica]OAL39550.1 hypothetical protein AYO20_00947 [Fonsecaea nubica]
MTENRYRPNSPPLGRRYPDHRASTGMVISSSFDPRFSSSSQPRSFIDTFPATRHGSVYTTQAIARKTVLDDPHSGGGSIVKTEYSVRPRTNSTLEARRPVNTFTERRSSPPRIRPAIVSGPSRDDPRSPVVASREDRYLVPAATSGRHHHRHASATRAEQDRLLPARVSRQPEYHRRGGYNAYPYSSARSQLQDEGFSYTTPKEQFLQESARPQRRESYSRSERPVSIAGFSEYRLPARRDTRDVPPTSSTRVLDRIDRNEPPRYSSGRTSDLEDRGDIPRRRHSTRAPVLHHYPDDGTMSAREERDLRLLPRSHHDRLEDDDKPLKHRHRDERNREALREVPRESERVRERERDRDKERERDKDRDRDRDRDRERDRDRDRDRDRERDRDRDRDRDRYRDADKSGKPRSRESSPEHSGLRKGLAAAAGLGAVGAAAGAALKSTRNKDDEESETDDRKERKHRRRRHHDEPSPDELAGRIERDLKLTNGDRDPRRRDDDRDADDTGDHDDRHERRRHHRHRKQRDRADRAPESDTTEDYDGKDTRQRRARDQTSSRDEDQEVPTVLEQRTISPGEDDDDRPRKVQLVEPAEKKEEFRPKGILKKPRETPFPEDPNPTREGVAPLKDAHKDGIPPNARWTKISRALVNPEALEKAHERFEERDDYVIVLRVVSREEITKLAEKTKEIREARERKWQAELEEKRRRRAERGEYSDESSDDEYSEEEGRPLRAIEQPPPAQGLQGDPRAYLAQQQRVEVPVVANTPPGQPSTATAQQPLPATGAYPAPTQQPQQGLPVPDIRVEPTDGTYSTNV